MVASWAGDAAAARPLLEQALALSRELDDKFAIVWWLEKLAWALLDLGELSLAQDLAYEGVAPGRAAAALSETCEFMLPQARQLRLDQATAAAGQALGPAVATAALSQGRATPLGQLIAEELEQGAG